MSNPSQFSFLSNKQYLLWKLKAKIWYSIEVTEVEIAVSGGRRRGQGPGEKKFDPKFWNLQFSSYTNVIHFKRKLRTWLHKFILKLSDLYLGCLWIKLRIFVTMVWSCEKWQEITWPMSNNMSMYLPNNSYHQFQPSNLKVILEMLSFLFTINSAIKSIYYW